MTRNSKKELGSLFVCGLVSWLILCGSGCGKSVNVAALADSGGSPKIAPSCGPSQQVSWNFVQPQPTVNHAVDLLFVMTTSDSMANKRARVAASISSFVKALAPGIDFRIAVMLGHGGASPLSGTLYAPSGGKLVLNSQTRSLAQIQADLKDTLNRVVPDVDTAEGETMLYSFLKSLEPSHFQKIQSQGFYRNNAALAVVFVTDEGDNCYPANLHGYTSFPDYVATGAETDAYKKYCLNPDGTEAITPERVLAALWELKPGGQFAVGGVVHVDPNSVPQGNEEQIGHGIVELVSAAQGTAIEISLPNYTAGLAQFGTLSSSTLDLQTAFLLGGGVPIVEGSVQVSVDSQAVPFNYDAGATTAYIQLAHAGHAGSKINVLACKK